VDLSVHLLRNYCVANGAAADHAYGLPIYKLRRATESIEENLREDLTLTRISETLAMSSRHLAPAFKTTTGLAPLIMSSSGASSAGLGFWDWTPASI
jgi:AraC-like DNA-binding protein